MNMDHDDFPNIFQDMRFYVHTINHPERKELVLKLTVRPHPSCPSVIPSS